MEIFSGLYNPLVSLWPIILIVISFPDIWVSLTLDPWYIEVGESMINSLNSYNKVEGGFASIRDVTTMQLEDHQHSFFLAET